MGVIEHEEELSQDLSKAELSSLSFAVVKTSCGGLCGDRVKGEGRFFHESFKSRGEKVAVPLCLRTDTITASKIE